MQDIGPLTPRPDARSEAADPVRVRPNRPTPPPAEPVEPVEPVEPIEAVEPVEEHSTSDELTPAGAPPPKADKRHSGMPLD